jgi:hypothetical protein
MAKAALQMANDSAKEFDRIINGLAHRHQLWRVFSDFCEMSALAIQQSVARTEEREKRYLEIAKAYNAEELKGFAQALACVTLALEEEHQDFLGAAFMRLELGNHWKGQFFTPYHVCALMAQMSTHDAKALLETREFITMMEPACGAGAMIIALSEAFLMQELNPQTQMHVTCVDVDYTAAHMTYVQLSLLGIPAYVVVGNSLSLEEFRTYTTPMHHLGFWPYKLKRRNDAQERLVGAAAGERAEERAPALPAPDLHVVARTEPGAVSANPDTAKQERAAPAQLSLFDGKD